MSHANEDSSGAIGFGNHGSRTGTTLDRRQKSWNKTYKHRRHGNHSTTYVNNWNEDDTM